MIVFAGGLASATTVEDLGQLLASGGTLSRSIIASGGQEIVYSAGLAVGTSVGSAATETVSSSGTASGTAVSGGNGVSRASIPAARRSARCLAVAANKPSSARRSAPGLAAVASKQFFLAGRRSARWSGAAAFKSWSQRV